MRKDERRGRAGGRATDPTDPRRKGRPGGRPPKAGGASKREFGKSDPSKRDEARPERKESKGPRKLPGEHSSGGFRSWRAKREIHTARRGRGRAVRRQAAQS